MDYTETVKALKNLLNVSKQNYKIYNTYRTYYINDITINEIDIALLKKVEHSRFNLVLVFETIEHDEYSLYLSKYKRFYNI
jgi:hypothetical protein